MATEMLQYLDPDGLDETVLNIGQIKTSLEGQISDLGESIEEEMQNLPYARPDGVYPDMTVGAVIGADETAQWLQRTTEGSGSATVRSVLGAAIGWNQSAPEISDANWQRNMGVTVIFNDGVVRQTFVDDGVTTASSARVEMKSTFFAGNGVYNHKFLIVADVKPSKNMQTQMFLFGKTLQGVEIGKTILGIKTNIDVGVKTRVANIITETNEDVYWIKLGVGICGDSSRPVLAGDYCDVSNAMLFDLTQMFGAGNEPSTVAEFEAMYPAAYYPYSAPTLKPVQISGIRSTDAQGGELDAIEWAAQTLRAAGSVADMLYSDHVDVNVGVVDLGTLNWSYYATTSVFFATLSGLKPYVTSSDYAGLSCAKYVVGSPVGLAYQDIADGTLHQRQSAADSRDIIIKDVAYTTPAAFKTAVSGVLLYYQLATPTMQPISPALPMTYRVQAGGNESIIVPDGDVSAAPVLTVAEPVNAGDEFARIWEAIQSLGYTRNAAQLSRPVSLTDIGSIDEVQKDTTDVVEIEVSKEVQE